MRARLTTGFVVLALGLTWAGPSASAHASLVASEPTANASVRVAPDRVRLTFTEPPDRDLAVVHVLDTGGRAVERDRAEPDPADRHSLVVPLRGLGRGSYTVAWRVTSTVDGHTTAGSFAFGVGVAASAVSATASVPRTPPPTPVGVLGRWVLYLGLTLLAGAAAVRLLAPSPATQWPGAVLVVCAVAVAAGFALTAFNQAAVAESDVMTLLRSRTGRAIRIELAAAGLLLLAVVCWLPRRGRVATGSVLAAVLLAMLAKVDAGHPAASASPWLAVPVQWAHIAAVGAWLGGLPFFALALGRSDAADRASVARRFSRLATAGLAVVVGTGTLRALDDIGAWRQLTSTSFGKALLVKLAIVAVVIAIGATNRFRHLAAAGTADVGPLRARVRVEASVAALVLLVTAVLTGLPPSKSLDTANARRAAPVVVRGSDFATSVRVRLQATPGGAGLNRFDVRVVDYDTGRPAPASAIAVRFQFLDRDDVPSSTLALRRSGGRWVGRGANLSIGGRWRTTVLIERAGGGLEVPVELETALPPQRVDAQRTAGLPTIYTVTGAGGRQVQVYLDPGKPGENELHTTFFTAAGAEEDIASVSVRVANGGSAQFSELTNRRLTKGHFSSAVDVRTGRVRIHVTANASDGSTLRYRLTAPVD